MRLFSAKFFMVVEINQKKENNSKNVLEEYVKEWKIFIDTCSILHPAINKFWKNIIPLLEFYKNKIIIPFRVIEELKKHEMNISNSILAKNSKEALITIKYLAENN